LVDMDAMEKMILVIMKISRYCSMMLIRQRWIKVLISCRCNESSADRSTVSLNYADDDDDDDDDDDNDYADDDNDDGNVN